MGGENRRHVRAWSGPRRAGVWVLLAVLLAFGQVGTVVAQTPEASPAASPVASPVAGSGSDVHHGIQIADMDLSVAPGYDFYRFANGGWVDRATIPAGRGRFSTFDEISQRVDAQLQAIVTGTAPDATTDLGKVRLVYDMTLDWETRNAQGVAPLQPTLAHLAAIDSTDALMTYLATQGFADNVGLFSLAVGPSADDATMNVATLGTIGLGLPTESYYLEDSPENEAVREAWVEATATLLVAAGYTEADALAAARNLLALDTELARITTTSIAYSENASLANNPRTIEELQALVPAFDWTAWFTSLGIPDVDTVVVSDLQFMEGVSAIIAETPVTTLRDKVVTDLMWESSDYLSADIRAVADGFDGVLRGISAPLPDETQALRTSAGLFPDALSKAYVEVAFPPEAKAQIEELVGNILAAFRQRILASAWMSEETKLRAIEKLDLINVKVGYPETWETYADVAIGDSLYATVMTARMAQYRDQIAQAGKPVDRTAWDTPAYEVNAFYSPSGNEIVFPAAILQAPFFDPDADAASNYGGIGAVIGHEITHGFDLTGSQYDGYGNVASWWTPEDRAAFEALNTTLEAQFSAVEVLPGLHVNGEQTIGENVADFGGTQTAYDALMLHLARGPQPQDQVWFLTQQQRFFIATSSNFRVITTDAFLRNQVATDPHAPGIVRATLPARNMDAFYEAFGIQPGEPMYIAPEDRVVIW